MSSASKRAAEEINLETAELHIFLGLAVNDQVRSHINKKTLDVMFYF